MLHAKYDPLHPRRHEFFHSSGYTDASGARNHVGSTNSTSFGQRLETDANRQIVNRYDGVRHIGSSRPHTPLRNDRHTSSPAQPRSTQNRPNPTPPVRRTFTEPPRRGYNPYS